MTAMEVISEVDDIVVQLVELTLPQTQAQFPSELNVVVDIQSLLNK